MKSYQNLVFSDINYVIVGPGKTGSYWLSQCLREHPNIYMAYENNYLTHFQQYGLDWWREYFRLLKEQPIIGDYANWYASFEDIPRMLAEINPTLKIIFCVRHPVRRVVSFYRHDLRWGTLGRHVTFSNAICEDLFYHRYIYSARYALHIRRFLEHFPAEQVYVFTAPEEADSVLERLADLYRWLGVEPIAPPSAQKRLNHTVSPLVPFMHRHATFGKSGPWKNICHLLDPLNVALGERWIPSTVSETEQAMVRRLLNPTEELAALQELFQQYNLHGSLGLSRWE